MGIPNEREKVMGSARAWMPVTRALRANVRLIVLKVGRRKFMLVEMDEDCFVGVTEPVFIKIKYSTRKRRNEILEGFSILRNIFVEDMIFF